jgi:uncharacterized membrane protein
MGRQKSIRKFFRENFFSGLFILIPVSVSLYVLIKIAAWLYDELLIMPVVPELLFAPLLESLPVWTVPWVIRSMHLAEFLLVLIGLFTFISFIGLIAKWRLFNWFLNRAEGVLRRIPLIGTIYSALQQLMTALFSGKGTFTKVVIVEFPREGLWSVGFQSRDPDPEVVKKVGVGPLVSVFVPTTPNPTTGFLIMLPPEKIFPVNISIEGAFKMIMSGGMAQPEEQLEPPLKKLRRTVASAGAEKVEQ